MKKWLILIIMIAAANLVYADSGKIETYQPNQVFDLSVFVTNTTGPMNSATCVLTIKKENYTTVLNTSMNSVGDGWYNATYNTSQLGKYYCTQTCTSGSYFGSEVCNFIIEGGERMTTAIILGLMFIIISYFVILRYFSEDMFGENGLVRMFLFLALIWILLIPMYVIQELNSLSLASAGIANIFDMLYIIIISINVMLTFFVFLWFFVGILNKIKGDTSEE